MVASTSLNASVELARAIASMHTILRTGPVIASGLDDQRCALGDWRNYNIGFVLARVVVAERRDGVARSEATVAHLLLRSPEDRGGVAGGPGEVSFAGKQR